MHRRFFCEADCFICDNSVWHMENGYVHILKLELKKRESKTNEREREKEGKGKDAAIYMFAGLNRVAVRSEHIP